MSFSALCVPLVNFLRQRYYGGVSYQMRENPQFLSEIKQKAQMHADKLLDLLQKI